MKDVLTIIVNNSSLHARWLNTLSYLENVGARKISACENDRTLDIVQLKHAAEEHRHAYYLKKQLSKLTAGGFLTYEPSSLYAPWLTKQYLNKLDIAASRYIRRHFELSGNNLKFSAYLFVTYAIEMRADELYPIYQEVLSEQGSKIMVKSIILEEEGHLEEMTQLLAKCNPDWQNHANEILKIEKDLFNDWFTAVEKETFYHECFGTKVA